jgi:hypothetical protein
LREALAVLVVLAASPLAGESLGTISGVVLSAVSGAPLAASIVTLSRADGAPLKTITADRRGRYVFEALPAGHYTVKAARAGFASGSFGQKAWNTAGRVIELGAGQGLSADIRLHRLGVITGSVVDENGEGIPGFTVNAVTVNPKGISGRVSSSGITDDRGVYRIPGLKPGRYYVVTQARSTEDGAGLLPTYAPGVLDRAEARIVTVEVDRETGGVHVIPVTGRLLRLSGSAPQAVKQHQAAATVTLFHDEDSRQVPLDSAGEFVFSALVPGRYTLVALLKSPAGSFAAYQTLDLTADLDGVFLNLTAAPELQIRLVDESGTAVNDPQFMVFASRIENGARTPPLRMESPAVSGLLPGRWRLFVVTPDNSYLDAVSVGGEDGLEGFQLEPGKKALATIRVSRTAGRITGKVLAAGNAAPGITVICYPASARNRARLGGFRTARSGLAGDYRFGGLPPGEYLVFATEIEDFQPEEQAEMWRDKIAPVAVKPSGEVVHEVRMPDE